MMENKNPFDPLDYDDGTAVTIEMSLAALYEWLLRYGFESVVDGQLHNTNLDRNLHWSSCIKYGVMEYKKPGQYALTRKVLEVLEEYGHGGK